MVTYTNSFLKAADTLTGYLQDEYPALKRPGKVVVRDVAISKDFAHGEFYRIEPISDTLIVQYGNDLADSDYIIHLHYYTHRQPEFDFRELSDIAARTKQLLLQHADAQQDDSWYIIDQILIDYQPPLDGAELQEDGTPREGWRKITYELSMQIAEQIYEN